MEKDKIVEYGIVYILPDDNDERGDIFATEKEAKDFAKTIDKEKYNGYRVMKIESHEEDGERIYDDEIVIDSEDFDEVEESLGIKESKKYFSDKVLTESKLEKTTFEDIFKSEDKKYAKYISKIEDALGAEELYGGNILEIKNIICHMTYNIYDDGVDAEFEFQFDALVDGDFDEDEMKPHWIRFKLFNDGPAFNGYYTEYGPEVESKDEVMMDVSCYKGNQAIIELLQEAGYEPTYNGVLDLLTDNVNDPYETDESLKEAEEDDLSDDELDALDAEEEKAFKQKQADRRARVAGKRKEKSDKEAKLAELKKQLGSEYDFDKLFDILVPPSGKADTVAGEVIRALNKVDYRDFNDGDIFYEGDGLDTCGGAMAFVAEFFLDRFNDSEDTDTVAEDIYNEIINMAEDRLTDSAYRAQLYDLEKQVVAWIKAHEDTLVEPNDKDCLTSFKGEEYWADYIPSYDIEDVSLPKNVEELLDLGEIDEDDIVWAVQDMIQGMGNSTDDVTYDGWGITVRGLSKADYDELGGDQGAELYDWLEQWAQDEYDDPDEIRARKEEEERQQYADDEEESEEGSEEETDESLGEATGYDHYGAKEMEPFKGPAYIQYDGGPRQIDVLTKARNHRWVWKNKAGVSDDEWYIFPSFEDALKVQKEVGGEIMSWNQYAGIKDEPEDGEEDSLGEGMGLDDYITVSKQNELTRKHGSYEYARKLLVKEFNDKVKEFPYWVIKTSEWWDPEGLNIPDGKYNIWFGGSEEECKSWLKDKYQKSLNDKEYCDVEKYEDGKYLTVYYPHAIARATYTVTKNLDNKTSESYNDKELKEDASMDLWHKLEPLYNEGGIYFDVVEKQEGGDFIIFEDWKSLIAVEKALKPEFEPKDEYDTSVLDELDIDYGFSDEWGRCDNCGKLIRLEADSAHWVPDFFWDDNGIICGNCVRQNPEEYIAWLLEQPVERANTILDGKALESAGFHKVDGNYENGWYDRHDSPEEILNKAYEEHPEAEFIFSISGVGKFAVQFELWMRGE